jgi:hypothetical protein
MQFDVIIINDVTCVHFHKRRNLLVGGEYPGIKHMFKGSLTPDFKYFRKLVSPGRGPLSTPIGPF